MIPGMSFRVLIVDDELEFARSLAEYLEGFAFEVTILIDPAEWQSARHVNVYDAILLDIRMPKVSGFDLLAEIRLRHRDTPVMMISGHASVENIVQSMRIGATNFYEKPIKLPELTAELERLRSVRETVSTTDTKPLIVTENAQMREILGMVEKIAETDAPVLITGESGTGKELIANSLHVQSRRRAGEFVKLNCASIPDTLFESELFGHESGAFTDAKHARMGTFERANGGTLFFDEVGELSMNVQAKLLRVIQDGRFERLGGTKTIHSDVRIIGATNRDIEEAIIEKRYREDLYYRLAVVTLEIPPLRNRREDILPLAHYFLKRYAAAYGRRVSQFGPDVEQAFLAHDWFGNVRELKNAIERAVIFCEHGTMSIGDLPNQYRAAEFPDRSTFDSVFEHLSREMILDALQRSGGKKIEAARLLKVHRKTLYNRMKRLGIDG